MSSSTLTESASSPVRAITRAVVTQASKPEVTPIFQCEAESLTGLVGRNIPFVADRWMPVDEFVHNRCQLGEWTKREDLILCEIENVRHAVNLRVKKNNDTGELHGGVQYFRLIAWGATWSDAVTMWKGRAK